MNPTQNQDYFLIDESVWNEKAGFLFVIADGMKSENEHCRVASLCAKSIYSKYYAETSDNRMMALKNAFEYANHKVCQVCPDVGAACTAALFHGETLHIAQVGNSRAYRLRSEQLTQITQDHSLAAAFIQKGHVTEEDLKIYHHSLYELTRWLGNPSAVEVDIFTETLQPKDSILLCTKGLSGWLHDEDSRICEILKLSAVENAAQALLEPSERAGRYMDATAIVISLE